MNASVLNQTYEDKRLTPLAQIFVHGDGRRISNDRRKLVGDVSNDKRTVSSRRASSRRDYDTA